jgi:hypothetical protein
VASNIFTFLNQITLKRGSEPYDRKAAPAYMLTMWLSHDDGLLDVVNDINDHQFALDDELVYTYYLHKVPGGKRYIRWIKKDKENSEEVKELMERYDISKREAMLLL